jgi:hypothetical protein
MDFPKLSREYAGEGANLLLVPAWDFNLDRWLHAPWPSCAQSRTVSGLLDQRATDS